MLIRIKPPLLVAIFTAVYLHIQKAACDIYEVNGQVRIDGWDAIDYDPWGWRSTMAKLGYMPTMKREGIETMDYGRGRQYGVRTDEPYQPAATGEPRNPKDPASNAVPRPLSVENIMTPVDTGRPLLIAQWVESPICPAVLGQRPPISTNKFWSNWATVDGLSYPVYTQPYMYRFDHGTTDGSKRPFWGMSINQPGQYRDDFAYTSHSDALKDSGHFTGPDSNREDDTKHYGVKFLGQHFHISAKEFVPGISNFYVKNTTEMFAMAVLTSRDKEGPGSIKFPLCQGAVYVTALFDNLTPVFESEDPLTNLTRIELVGQLLKDGELPIQKWELEFGGIERWWVYMIPTIHDRNTGYDWSEPSYHFESSQLRVENITTKEGTRMRVVGTHRFHGIVQVVHFLDGYNPGFDFLHDDQVGRFCTGAKVRGRIVDDVGYYGIVWQSDGLRDKELAVYAFPHHRETLCGYKDQLGQKMRSTVKGEMTAVFGNTWKLKEPDLPLKFGLFPWTEDEGPPKFSRPAFNTIKAALDEELKETFDMSWNDPGPNHDSVYWAGKSLAKHANTCITAAAIYGQFSSTMCRCLEKLATAFARFTTNRRTYNLVFDETWGGIVNSLGFEGLNLDYGNMMYNDHHFHYGYIVYAAAVLARFDRLWLTEKNKNFVHSLIRDYNNPSSADPFFPVFRNFDWFHGHSWAHGLDEQYDGRDQESTSEDAFASFAIKLWGEVTNRHDMLGRGALMLAVQKRAINKYFVMWKTPPHGYRDEDIHPRPYHHNLFASIAFEGKLDTTTFFGHNRAFIHGIHIVPVSPIMKFIKDKRHVEEVHKTFFATDEDWDKVPNDWKGTLMMEKALYDPRSVWDWFMTGWDPKNQTLVRSHIDQGASLSYYLLTLVAWGESPGQDSNGFWDQALVNGTRDAMGSPVKVYKPDP
ncbi:glycoside hydrolase [Ascodesmis nigricans]|uniref:glucan endo-1,3-beta-D-glucosidase n=1 Tax=Ascodesmis nigricans TaxID=341454 RepID=A0A4S2MSY3_9PEZI|nr:glycoside hydrolase [Ascodesmis nigricans]